MDTWWECYPGWYKWEIAQLENCSSVVLVDEIKEAGKLILKLEYSYKEEKISLQVVCGAYYPYSLPAISTPGRKLSRHRGGSSEHLCLLAHTANGDHDWVAFEDTIAGMIETQVPEVLQISDLAATGELDTDVLKGREMEVGEPQTAFLFNASEGGFIIDEYGIPNEIKNGQFTYELKDAPHGFFGRFIRGEIIQVSDTQGNDLSSTNPESVNDPQSRNLLSGQWFRGELPDSIENISQLWPWLEKTHPLKAKSLVKKAKKHNGTAFTLGVLLEEEILHLENGHSWIFFSVLNNNNSIEYLVSLGLRASKIEMQMRVPELSNLKNKKVLVVGLGSIGSPVAVQLAKAGVGELHLIDKDVVTPGNTVRWAIGMSSVGFQKALALREYIINNYPFVKTIPVFMYINHPEASQSDVKKLIDIIKQVDLVIDATASIEVNEYLSARCADHKTAYQWLSTTEGTYGGIIGRILPDQGHSCWMGYYRRLDNDIELPHYKEGGAPVPAGCVSPTFTGAGIDCDQVGIFAARMALSTLCAGKVDTYPPIDWDVGVFNFRNKDGSIAIAPIWKTYNLDCPPTCKFCNEK